MMAALALPSLDRVPPVYTGATVDALAAQAALALDRAGKAVQIRRHKGLLEHAALSTSLEAWLAAQCADLKIFDPGLRVFTGASDFGSGKAGKLTVYFGNRAWDCLWHDVWTLERRFPALEHEAPGLAQSAMQMIERAGQHALPVYTPGMAFWHASHVYWMGEMDEKEAIAQYCEEAATDKSAEPATAEDLDIFTRAQFDAAIPPAASWPKLLPRKKLEAYARRTGGVRVVARLVIELQEALRCDKRVRDGFEPQLSSEYDSAEACAWALTLRWSMKDPMARIFDDLGQEMAQVGYIEAFCWYEIEPDRLPAWLAHLERRFAIARLVERLIPYIAQPSGRRS